MASTPTTKSPSPWLTRIAVGLALLLITLGLSAVAGWLLPIVSLVQWQPKQAPITMNSAIGFVLFGAVLLGLEFGRRRLAWLSMAGGLIGLLTLAQSVLGQAFGIDELIVRDTIGVGLAQAGRMAPITSLSFVVVGAFLPWLAVRRGARIRTLGLALAGSVLAAVGFSTLIGYGLGLPAVYGWGGSSFTPPGTAVMLANLGLALLLLAWREQRAVDQGPPTWLPLPVVVASATLTVILNVGLRDREIDYRANDTKIAINTVASTMVRRLEEQGVALDALARRWLQTSHDIREAEQTQLLKSSEGFWKTIVWVEPNGAPVKEGRVSPLTTENPLLPEVRQEALARAIKSGTRVVSASLPIQPNGSGFSIYSPIYRNEVLDSFLCGDVTYRSFVEKIIKGLKIENDYTVNISIGAESIYGPVEPLVLARETQNQVFSFFDRRVRVELTPTADYLRRKRSIIPELALGAGFGITLLLGLSVHLARAASSGLRAAEDSNRRLEAENEERRRVEAMLKVSDERLRLALDSTQIGIFEWNLTTSQLYYSPGLWTMLGYPPGRVAPSPEAWIALIHPEDLPSYRAAIEQQFAGTIAFIEPEYRVRAGTGEWRWLYMRSKAVAGSAGGPPTRIIGTMQDVTARKEAEQALRASQAEARKLSLVASKTDNLVIIANPNGTIDWVNDSFERVMEYPLAEVRGKNPATFMVGPETNSRTIRRIRAALTRGEGVSTDVVNYSKSGRKYHLHLEVQPVFNEKGVIETYIAIEADITSRVETESNLRRAKVEADAASRAKSEFLASMSHEIRTPMNGVIGMTSLLLETPLTVEQRDCVSTIRTSGEALLTIINDILDFSKIESGKMELERLPFELTTCIEEALDLFSVHATAKKIELVYFVDPAIPHWIIGDVTRMRQVLVNLVNNAVKFTPTGMISIEVNPARVPADFVLQPGNMLIDVAVRDSGIGIPPDRVNRLFKPFSQVDSSTTRKYGGTGLGLAICHRLTNLMGGDIRVESEVGEGSTFAFTFQTVGTTVPRDAVSHPLPAALKTGSVLCVEHNALTRRRLETFFSRSGVAVTAVATTTQSLERLAATPAPTAIVVDAELTVDELGATLRERIRQLGLPTVVLLPQGISTIHAFGERHLFATAGKPLKTLSLVRALQTLFPASGTTVHTASPLPTTRLLAEEFPLDVLLVEDNAVNQKVALRFLDRLGYRADAVANGIECLAALDSRPYQLILMDLQMPEMDGFEASRQIRTRYPADRQPKIIALTANALQGDRELCLEAGMDDYVTKPVKLGEIADCIRRQFGAPATSA